MAILLNNNNVLQPVWLKKKVDIEYELSTTYSGHPYLIEVWYTHPVNGENVKNEFYTDRGTGIWRVEEDGRLIARSSNDNGGRFMMLALYRGSPVLNGWYLEAVAASYEIRYAFRANFTIYDYAGNIVHNPPFTFEPRRLKKVIPSTPSSPTGVFVPVKLYKSQSI